MDNFSSIFIRSNNNNALRLHVQLFPYFKNAEKQFHYSSICIHLLKLLYVTTVAILQHAIWDITLVLKSAREIQPTNLFICEKLCQCLWRAWSFDWEILIAKVSFLTIKLILKYLSKRQYHYANLYQNMCLLWWSQILFE